MIDIDNIEKLSVIFVNIAQPIAIVIASVIAYKAVTKVSAKKKRK